MSHTINDLYLEDKRIEREMWLSDMGLHDGHIMIDLENGQEYVYEKTEGEYDPYDEILPMNTTKIYLPLELQKDYFPF